MINGEVVQYTFTEPEATAGVPARDGLFEGNTNEITRTILVANDSRPTAVIELWVNGHGLRGER